MVPGGAPTGPGRPAGGLDLANLLLGLGTALVAVAVVAFTAVNWERFGALGQGGLLLALTATAVWISSLAVRRDMTATGEAVGLVAVLLALADVHALRVGIAPDVAAAIWWAPGLAVVAGGGWLLGRRTGIASTRIAAAGLGQLALPVGLVAADLGASGTEAILLLQVGVVAVLALRAPAPQPEAQAVALTTASLTWVVAATTAFASTPFVDSGARLGAAGVLALAAAVAALVAGLRARSDVDRTLALGTATVVGFVAALVAVDVVATTEWALVSMAGLAVAVVVVGVREPRRWGRVPSSLAAGVAGLASLPVLVASIQVLSSAGGVATRPWTDGAGANAAALYPGHGSVVPTASLAAHLALLAALALAAVPVLGRRLTGSALVGVALVSAVVAPLLVPLSAGGAMAVALLAGVGLAAPAWQAQDRRKVVAASSAMAAMASVAVLWSCAAQATSLVAAAVVAGLAAVVALAARRRGWSEGSVAASTLALVAASTAAAVGSVLAGLDGRPALVIGALVAAVLTLVAGQLLDPAGRRRDLDGTVAVALDVTAGLVHVWTLAVVALAGDVGATSLVLATGTVATGLAAARPGRRGLVGVAVAEGLALTWLRLGLAGVTAPEAYTGPVALVLAASGLLVELRSRRAGEVLPSWATVGPALVVALLPTTLLGLTDPGLVRPLGGLVAGAVVLVLGVVSLRRAAVDVGVVVVALLGLRQLLPAMAGLPDWATVGATGLALVAMGATFEQRRRDVHHVRRRYASLR